MRQLERRATVELADIVRLESGFVRAVNIADNDRLDELPRLKVTPNIVRALAQITGAIDGSKDRAWAIVGPYGAGKSTFGLLVAGLLSQKRTSGWVRTAIEDLQRADPALGSRLDAILDSPPCVPVLLQGGPQSLGLSLGDRLAEVNEAFGSALLDPADLNSIQERGSRMTGPHELAHLVQRAVSNSRKAGYAGIVILIDEFGRFLDQVTNGSARANLAIAQELAELGTRTKRGELHLFVLLHQNFEDYALGVGSQERTEWSKIQGRFRQIALLEDPDNLYELMARCIHLERRGIDLAELAMSSAWELVKDIAPFGRSQREWSSRLSRLFPLHPLSVYCLPRLSSLIGQNERTIFSFLMSDEPHSLRAFLWRPSQGRELSLLGLDWLCDYFLLNQVNSFVPMRLRRRLAQVTYALEQVASGDELASRIIKVIGILEIVQAPEIPPSEGVLAAALNVTGEKQWARFRRALKALVDEHVLVERRYAGEFHISPGSDFDLTGAIGELTDQWRASHVDVATLLNEQVQLPPLIARRHSFETGAVRLASRRFLDLAQLQSADTREEGWKPINKRADISIGYVICSRREELKRAERLVARHRVADQIFVLTEEPLDIQDLLLQARAIGEILARDDVQRDPVAVQEADLHLQHLRSVITRRVQPLLDPGLGSERWFWRGREQAFSTERDVQSFISNVCDRVFCKSPKIVSELINRRQLSTASVVAVKKIITGLLESQHASRLGFTGNGPEVTIFHAVFERPGWHRADGPDYRLTAPGYRYHCRPVWNTLRRFLDSAADRRRRLSDLWDELARPPYGVRAGLAPLLIWGALIERRGECCLFERGTYMPTWSAELYDRFLRTPEEFEIRTVPSSALDGVLGNLHDALPAEPACKRGEVRINDLLQALFGWYRSLPDYAKRTNTLSPEAREFRRLLSSATDPIDLVLRQFPLALGVRGDMSSASTSSFAEYNRRFGRVVQELSQAYPSLLTRLVSTLAAMLDSDPSFEAVQAELSRLRDSLFEEVTDPMAKAFLLRASAGIEESNAWVESVAAVVIGQPPRYWTDQSVEEFEEQLAVLVQRLRQTEKASVVRARDGLAPATHARWLTLIDGTGQLIDEVVDGEHMSSATMKAAGTAEAMVRDLVAELGRNERRQVLVELIERLWKEE